MLCCIEVKARLTWVEQFRLSVAHSRASEETRKCRVIDQTAIVTAISLRLGVFLALLASVCHRRVANGRDLGSFDAAASNRERTYRNRTLLGTRLDPAVKRTGT